MHEQCEQLIVEALANVPAIAEAGLADTPADIARTRDSRHGDFTSNVAMRLAKPLRMKPRDIANEIVAALPESAWVTETSIAGPGFINFTLSETAYHATLKTILETGAAYGTNDRGAGEKVLVEYVSANPTGPLHVGHGRLAAYGASVSSLLRAVGYDVAEEYYVNDAGRQMDILAASVWVRYAELAGDAIPFPKKAYQGDYVIEIARTIHASGGDCYLTAVAEARAAVENQSDGEMQLDGLIAALKEHLGEDGFSVFFNSALDTVLADIKDDLAEFGVTPDRWYSERSLVDNGALEAALTKLKGNDVVYEKEQALWFRATDYGDDKDRVVQRDNGNTTYFASDIAYHLDKRNRGFEQLIDIWGSDHHGYIARVRAGMEAMGEPAEALEVKLVQFVTLFRGDQKLQMSTRSGSFVTLRELRAEVGNDATRFFYVLRGNDQHLDFDLELATSKSNENPVYYVQYAHARVASILRNLAESGDAFASDIAFTNLATLTEPKERDLLVALSRYPEVVELAANNRAPQQLVHYLRELAAGFHTYYNAHKVLVEDRSLRQARVCLSLGCQRVIANGLGLLGVSAPQEM